jgi:hypothetical protein
MPEARQRIQHSAVLRQKEYLQVVWSCTISGVDGDAVRVMATGYTRVRLISDIAVSADEKLLQK